MNYDEWVERYAPYGNLFDENASFDGTMYETYGIEYEYVKNYDSNNVWTYVSGDGDLIIPGLHFVNRMGYFITRAPHDDNYDLTIDLNDDGGALDQQIYNYENDHTIIVRMK